MVLVPGTLAGCLPIIIPASAFGANDRIRLTIIGHHGRGKDHIKGFMKQTNVEIVTLCDEDEKVNQSGAADFEKVYNKSCNSYRYAESI